MSVSHKMSERVKMNSKVKGKRPSNVPKPVAYLPEVALDNVKHSSPSLYKFVSTHFTIKEPQKAEVMGEPMGEGAFNKIFDGKQAVIGSKSLTGNEIFRLSIRKDDIEDGADVLEFVASFVTWGVGHEKGICPPIESMGYCIDKGSGDYHKMMVTEKCEGDLASVGSIPDEGRVIYNLIEKTAKAGLMLLDIKPENMLLCDGEAKMTDLDADWAYVESRKDTDKVLEKLRKWVMCTLYMGHEGRFHSNHFKDYVKDKAAKDHSFKLEMDTYTSQVKGLATKYLQGEEWMYKGLRIHPTQVEGLVKHYFNRSPTPSTSSSGFGSLETSPFAGSFTESEIRQMEAMIASKKKKRSKRSKRSNRSKRSKKKKSASKKKRSKKRSKKRTKRR